MLFKFEKNALKDLKFWKQNEKNIYKKIFKLLKNIEISPFKGIGKPEPLRENLSGFWSRRISQEHRLVYTVQDNVITVISCRYHY